MYLTPFNDCIIISIVNIRMQNPLYIGVAAAAAVYLYSIYKRSQEPEESRKNVSFLAPALVGCAVAAIVHFYINGGGFNDMDSDFESGLVNMTDIDNVMPRAPAPNLDVYTALWE